MREVNRNMEDEDRLLDKMLKSLDTLDFNCYDCAHLNDDEISCKAFPDGIPEDIISGQIAHDKPMFDQDNDLVFKKAS